MSESKLEATLRKIAFDDAVLDFAGADADVLACVNLANVISHLAASAGPADLARALSCFQSLFPIDQLRRQFPDASPIGIRDEIELRADAYEKYYPLYRDYCQCLVWDELAVTCFRLFEATGTKPAGFDSLKRRIKQHSQNRNAKTP